MNDKELIRIAFDAQVQAYAPYSGFKVGAALLGKSGKVYTGCNIENAAYTPTNCGERTAFFKAVSQGEREFIKIVIVGSMQGKNVDYCPPCGVCRQVMCEFCDPSQFKIILAKNEVEYVTYLLEKLQPLGFGPESFKIPEVK